MVVFMRCISQHAGPRNQYGHAACGVPRLHAYLQAEKNSEEEKKCCSCSIRRFCGFFVRAKP
jgi:hypothetical protein